MDDTEFERFFRSEYAGLVAFGAAVCGDRDVAQSLAQETLIRAYERWDDVQRHDVPVAWLRRVMHNLVVDHLRRAGAERRAVDRLATRTPGTADAAPSPVGVDHWFALVEPLTPDQRAAATLFYAEDLPVAEIAATLGISAGTVKSTLSKARRRMRHAIEQEASR